MQILLVLKLPGARFDDGAGGDNEVQRTMLELINQLDGFDPRGNIKVLMATNRPDTLDPALMRPGRLDRKIEFSLPDLEVKTYNTKTHKSDLCSCFAWWTFGVLFSHYRVAHTSLRSMLAPWVWRGIFALSCWLACVLIAPVNQSTLFAPWMSTQCSIENETLMCLLAGAEIRSVCTEAGMFAIRARRKIATEKDFLEAVNKVIKSYAKFSATPRYMTYN